MRYHLTFHPNSRQDISDAYNWYEDKLEGLGERFLAELDKAYNKLESAPQLFSHINHEIRKVNLSHFPFCIIYAIEGHQVTVLAIFHTSRNPEHLTQRLA